MRQSIYRLIADHAAALAALEEVPESVTADGSHNWEFTAASDAEERALVELINAVPRSTVELHRKAGYLSLHARHTEALDCEKVEALLLSLMEIRLHAS